MRRSIFALTLTALAAGTALTALPVQAATPVATATTSDEAALAQFFADYDAAQLARSPLGKSYRGIIDAD